MTRRPLAVAALAAALSYAPVARALPPTPLSAVTASPNVHLVTNVPTGVGVGGKFAGHYYFQTTARSATYSAPDGVSDGGLWVFDVAKPEAPSVVTHLPLPVWENEDVDLSLKRHVLLISADRKKTVSQVTTSPVVGGVLFAYDITDLAHPLLKSVTPMPATVGTRSDGTPLGGAGHIANCILECAYAYLTGSRDGSVAVVDLRDLSAPKVLGTVNSPAGGDTAPWTPGIVHDVNVDRSGNVWMTGSGGTALYAPVKDPLHPRLLASTSRADNARTDSYIHHNSLRLDGSTVLVGEESFDGCGGGPGDNVGGRFQSWRIDLRAKRLVPLSLYTQTVPGVQTCSSHWFDVNPGRIVADAWYEGGLRFLDLTNPRHVRQVGYLRTSDGAASQAQYVPGRPDLVYVSDYLRGLDVVRIDGAGARAKTVTEGDVAVARTRPITFGPSDDYGYACPVRL
jgi:hypothetical protein